MFFSISSLFVYLSYAEPTVKVCVSYIKSLKTFSMSGNETPLDPDSVITSATKPLLVKHRPPSCVLTSSPHYHSSRVEKVKGVGAIVDTVNLCTKLTR